MFVSSRRHEQELGRVTAELQSRDERIAELERHVYEVERTRHILIEEVRYVIEAGGDHVGGSDSLRGEHLKTLGHVLPYVLSRRRTWNGPEIPEGTDSALAHARQLASEYGFALPDDPVLAVKAMLDLAMVLFNPALSLPLNRLRNLYPLTSA